MASQSVMAIDAPDALIECNQWVMWKAENRKGAPTKIPYSALTGAKASSTNRGTWAEFDVAQGVHRGGGYAGIGFVFSETDDFAGVDIDHCRDAKTGIVELWAQQIITGLNSYAEISPSGTGVKIFVRGVEKLPGDKNRRDYHTGHLEFYDRQRYFVVTGQRVDGSPETVERRGQEFANLYIEVFGSNGQVTKQPPATVAADPVSVDLDAEPPADRFTALYASHDLFPLSWDRQRGKDLNDHSPSGHCMSIAMITLRAGWSDQEVSDTLVAWRRKHGEEIKERNVRLDIENAKEKIGADGKPKIIVGVDEARVFDEAIAAVAKVDGIYQRGGMLCHIIRNAPPPIGIRRPADAPRIVRVSQPRLGEYLSSAAVWVKTQKDGNKVVRPAEWIVKGVEARGEWPGIRPITAITDAPVLRADGTVVQEPGYDPATGVFYQPQIEFPPIPHEPTREIAIACRNAILEVVADFPFDKPEHRSGYVAGLLTLFARQAFAGPAPLFAVDSNVRGCGKGLLCDTLSTIRLGSDFARMTAPQNDEEARKRITSIAVGGESEILIDNISGTLGSPALDAALTSTIWKDRILGESKMTAAMPLEVTWFGTSNNLVVGPDTARRVLHIRLLSTDENPEERSGFAHDDLLAWVRAERGRLAAAAVTILRAYFVAGRPDMGLNPWGSFEGWSNLVHQAVVWVGLPDPGETRQELVTQADREAGLLRQLIHGWQEIDPDGDGMTVSAVLKELEGKRSIWTGAADLG